MSNDETKLTKAEKQALSAKLAELSSEHSALDAAIQALGDAQLIDQLKILRLKKENYI